MTEAIVTKAGIHLIGVKELSTFIKNLEALIPGWWWSLSQVPGRITFNGGPGRSCPSEVDNGLSLTKQADAGYMLHSIYKEQCDATQLMVFFEYIKSHVNNYRQRFESDGGEVKKAYFPWYRTQDDTNLRDLEVFYEHLFKKIPMFEEHYTLTEIYFGSCDTSADCSLRGERHDGSKFDVSVDLVDHGVSIGESLEWSITELTNDLITHGLKAASCPG